MAQLLSGVAHVQYCTRSLDGRRVSAAMSNVTRWLVYVAGQWQQGKDFLTLAEWNEGFALGLYR
jgi:hypothetical protein